MTDDLMTTNTTALRLPYAARYERCDEKRNLILRFLRENIYTTREVVAELLGTAATPAKAALARLQSEGLVYLAEPLFGHSRKKYSLWGITAEGQALAFNPEDEYPLERYFNPEEIDETRIGEEIALQLVCVRAKNSGWSDVVRFIENNRFGIYATSPEGSRARIEMNYSFCSADHYRSGGRFNNSSHFDQKVWITETKESAQRLDRILSVALSSKVGCACIPLEDWPQAFKQDRLEQHSEVVQSDVIQPNPLGNDRVETLPVQHQNELKPPIRKKRNHSPSLPFKINQYSSAEATAWAWSQIAKMEISPAAALVLLKLADFGDPSGVSGVPSIAAIAAETGLGQITVGNCYRELEASQLLVNAQTRERDFVIVYRLAYKYQ